MPNGLDAPLGEIAGVSQQAAPQQARRERALCCFGVCGLQVRDAILGNVGFEYRDDTSHAGPL
jgi:hypothetical protein